ncbi:MAG: sodium ion-translocating decarboxylase subunit beta, partial [Deltaproteobacteria bacterium]|nr:sodium ion-translocating decarboxylase subunit beta [Deltaproteobacteria bacterium]
AGVHMGKLMNKLSKHPISPLIGAAGSLWTLWPRVWPTLGWRLISIIMLMHAMGPNVAGVIGSAVAAGVMISLVGG